MKRLNTPLFIILAVLLVVSALKSNAQVYTATNYYYNNFDGGALGSGISQTSTSAALEVTNSSPLSGGYSLSSLGNGQAGVYKISALPENTNLSTEKFGWEWTLVYRNAGGATDANNEWKYWLTRESNQADSKGFYLTQEGGQLYLKYYVDAYTTHSFSVTSLSSNTTYAIRVQRLANRWQIYVNDFSSAPNGAYTFIRHTDWKPDGDNYFCSQLNVKSASAGRFKFDEIKMYSMQLLISGANEASNGISSPLYAGQQNAKLYGLKIQTRGLFEIYQYHVNLSGDVWNIFETGGDAGKLFKSFDSFYGNADDVFLTNVDFYSDKIQKYGYNDVFYSLGNIDGSMKVTQYYYFTGNVKSTAPSNTSFSFTGTTILQSQNTGVNYATDTQVVTTTSTTPSASGKVYDWVGNSSAWGTASNWRLADNSTPSAAPGVNDLVRIGVNKSYTQMPVVSASTSVGNLIVDGSLGAAPTLTINSNTTLTIAGTFTNQRNSTFLGNGSLSVGGNWISSGGKIDLTTGNVSINFNGAKEQLVKDEGSDSGNGVLFGNVTFSGGGTKMLGGTGKFAVAVDRYLTMGTSTILQTSGLLTLKASELGSASVAAIPSSSSIRGDVTVERYIQGGGKSQWRTYRMLSSPIYDNSTSFTNEDIVGSRTYSFKQFIDDIFIFGAAKSGFDQPKANPTSTTAWTYNDAFIAIPNINTNVSVGQGAYLLYMGNRSDALAKATSPFVDPESIVMTFKGTLNQQSITVPLVHGSGGFSLLGNPYAATIDWDAVTKTSNVSSVVRMWNPEVRQYTTYNGRDVLNGGSRYIGPGQAFFVQTADNSSPSVTFTESSKVGSVAQTSSMYNRVMVVKDKTVATSFAAQSASMVEETPAKVRVKLSRDGFANEDEALIVLQSGELANFFGYDVERSGGEAVFLSSLSTDKKQLAINYMPHVSSVSVVNLDVNVSNSGSYKMQFTLTGVPLGYQLKLRDKYLNTFTDLTNEDVATYQLTIDKAVAATMGDRFELLIAPHTTLPVNLTEFSGKKADQGVLLKWKTSSEENNSHFEIKRAGEEQIYTTLGRVEANGEGVYSLLDKSPVAGNNYYALVQVDKDGTEHAFQQKVVVKYELGNSTSNEMLIYPTIVESAFTLKYTGNFNSGHYILKISDITGKEIASNEINENSIRNGYTGALPAVSSGIYLATLIDAVSGKKLGATKLVKK